jgi:hypothetical protein
MLSSTLSFIVPAPLSASSAAARCPPSCTAASSSSC